MVASSADTGLERRSPDWASLAEALSGDAVRPGDSGYGLAVQLQIAEYDDVSPACVVYCADEQDVRTGLAFAAAHDVPLRLRSGGHSFAGWSTSPGLVLDLSRLAHVRTDGRTVHLGPGTQAVDALATLWPHGLAVANGMCPTVAAGGFVSGGGNGPQSRRFGLACDALVSARVVLADGRVLRCSADEHPDLFWALRGGGGGNFGAVVDFEVLARRIPHLVLFQLVWTGESAVDVLSAWQEWVLAAPDEASTSISLVLGDAAPGAPLTVVLIGTLMGPVEQARALIADLVARAGVEPVARVLLDESYYDSMMWLYGGGRTRTVEECHRVGTRPGAVLPRQQFQRERNRLFDRPLERAEIAALVRGFDADREADQTRFVNLTALGGAVNRVAPEATAYAHRDALFLVGHALLLPEAKPAADRAARAQSWVDRGFALLDPWSSGHSYVNFPDPHLTEWTRAYWGANHPRLLRVKRHYDPGGLFRLPQGIEG
ncbi:FAD-dependent oxidoreductase [Streptomyces sp. SID3343]|uniref:FAD-binding oxidoreductase n=1 Tax=Streptomyces sp. SID3343 TaxID=2690260 RepID=UPI001371B516|nr:FAD-dependent oxidoreductase [Streptomyces sp. SID3343]MYV98437.1 FAD-binding protein [Streptomyces sp. SID3343]